MSSADPREPREPREPWPSQDFIDSWFGDPAFELRPGESGRVDLLDPAAIEAARRFRDVLSRFASGVTVVTAISDGEPVGMTCQSFASVSLSPPLVLFCPADTSRAWPRIRRSGKFTVNFLAADQAELSNQMASRGTDKYAGVRWDPAPITGSPVLQGVLGFVDCTVWAVHPAGDHEIVIGRVQALDVTDAERALLFFDGRYSSTPRDA